MFKRGDLWVEGICDACGSVSADPMEMVVCECGGRVLLVHSQTSPKGMAAVKRKVEEIKLALVQEKV